MKLNMKLLIVSIVAGILAAVGVAYLYGYLKDSMSNRILIPLLFVAYAAVLCGVVSVWMAVAGKGEEAFWFLEGRMMLTIGLICGLVVLFFAAMLTEWLYDTDFKGQEASSSYIFVLDESGSMNGSDPNYQRYSAVEKVMNSMDSDVPFAVYAFATRCAQVRPMGPMADGFTLGNTTGPAADYFFSSTLDGYNLGGITNMQDALETVLADIKSGKLQAGRAPHVILLTDGYASDMDTGSGAKVLRNLSSEGVRVSTVGLGLVDTALMQYIANQTGGTYVSVNNATDLAQGFSHVATLNSQNDLLSQRTGVRTSVLYLVLRVLFLVALGALVGCLKGIACGQDFLPILLVTVAGALVGAVVMEICYYFGTKEFIPQVIYWALLSFTPGREKLPRYTTSSGQRQIDSSVLTHGGKGPSSGAGRVQW